MKDFESLSRKHFDRQASEYDQRDTYYYSQNGKISWNIFRSANNYKVPKTALKTDTKIRFRVGTDERGFPVLGSEMVHEVSAPDAGREDSAQYARRTCHAPGGGVGTTFFSAGNALTFEGLPATLPSRERFDEFKRSLHL